MDWIDPETLLGRIEREASCCTDPNLAKVGSKLVETWWKNFLLFLLIVC